MVVGSVAAVGCCSPSVRLDGRSLPLPDFSFSCFPSLFLPDVLGCIDAWATDETSCARIQTNTDTNALKSTALAEKLAPPGSCSTGSACKQPTAVANADSATGMSVTTSTGKVLAVARLPQRLAFAMAVTFAKGWTCADLVNVENTLRKVLCRQHTSAYKALGYASDSNTATKCSLSTLNTQYGDGTTQTNQCDSQLIAQDDMDENTKVAGGGRQSTHGRALLAAPKEQAANVVHVRATFQVAYPSADIDTDAEASQYVGQQLASTEMIAQQLHTLDEASLISSQFIDEAGKMFVEKAELSAIQTGPTVAGKYTTNATNSDVPCEKNWVGMCDDSGVMWVLLVVFGGGLVLGGLVWCALKCGKSNKAEGNILDKPSVGIKAPHSNPMAKTNSENAVEMASVKYRKSLGQATAV